MTILLGIIIGVASARYLANPSNLVVSQRYGNWYSWPSAGHPDSSPYSQARYLLAGTVPEHFSEVLTLYRDHDDDGGRLAADCTYIIAMQRPEARRWIISVFAEDGVQGAVLTQDDVISRAGRVELKLSGDPQPGNWLRLAADGSPRVVFRMYDGETILRQANGNLELPSVKLEGCS